MVLSELLDEFVLSPRAANRSAKTIDAHQWQIQRFQRFLDRRAYDADCSAITTRVIREYVADLQEEYAPQTITNSVKALKALFAFAVREQLLDGDPALRVVVPKVPQTDYVVYDNDDVELLLRACNPKTLTGIRDFAIVTLLFDSDSRASELIHITDDGIDRQRALVRVYGEGAKERQVPVSARTLRADRRYVNKANNLI